MSVHHDAIAFAIDRLGPADLAEAFAFVDRDPVLHVYLLALLLRDSLRAPHDECWAARRRGTIVALAYLGGPSGAVLPVGDDEAGLAALAERACQRLSMLPPRFQVIGPRRAVELFASSLARAGLVPRRHCHQIYLELRPRDLPAFEHVPHLRPARPEDYALVHESGALLRAEEIEEDPREVDPHGYARRVEEECRSGYTRLWVDAAGLCFRASVSARTADAAQVAGVYTPLERRNYGLARRGLSEMCTRLFESSQTACLFVNDFNAPALALYRHMGFRHLAFWASAFYLTTH